jgi:hypothetical protein
MAVKSAVMFIVVFITAGTAAAQNAQRNITLENTGPLADDLKAMKLKDSDQYQVIKCAVPVFSCQCRG